MAYRDWTYHGLQFGPEKQRNQPDEAWEPGRIWVEEPEFGPMERQDVTVLRELESGPYGDFAWGYNGNGTSRAAAAILADALELGDPVKTGISVDDGLEDDVLVRLREAFCDEVLSQDCAEWRLRRVVVLRWARSWYGQAAITALPDGLQLPALDDD
jgi:hypothetical protein